MSSNTSNASFDRSQYFRLQNFEDRAQDILPQSVYEFYASGEGNETTLRWNREKFENYRIIPRMLRDVSKRDISTTILGEKISMPLGVSPTAFQKMAHLDGECGNAKAVEAANTVFILSEFSTFTIDEVARAAPNAVKWMQVLISKDKDLTLHIVKRAEQAGFKALVLIVDSPMCGNSKANNFDTCLKKYISKIAILQDYVETKSDLSNKYLNNMGEFAHEVFNDSVTWKDIAWLKSVTKLPIILKGILSPEDALLGVKYGASAIFVSNHGGRQLDGVPATIEVLSDIVKALGDKVEIYVDGGIRCGTDIFKALALGARMVFIGRSMLWGLVCGGEKGAQAVLDILRNEIDATFALAGCSSVDDITRDRVVHESYFNR